jgi:hypothetical protein
MRQVKSLPLKDVKKIVIGNWVQIWTGKDIHNIDNIKNGIIVGKNTVNKWFNFFSIEDQDIDVIDYDQVIKIGKIVTDKNSGL